MDRLRVGPQGWALSPRVIGPLRPHNSGKAGARASCQRFPRGSGASRVEGGGGHRPTPTASLLDSSARTLCCSKFLLKFLPKPPGPGTSLLFSAARTPPPKHASGDRTGARARGSRHAAPARTPWPWGWDARRRHDPAPAAGPTTGGARAPRSFPASHAAVPPRGSPLAAHPGDGPRSCRGCPGPDRVGWGVQSAGASPGALGAWPGLCDPRAGSPHWASSPEASARWSEVPWGPRGGRSRPGRASQLG